MNYADFASIPFLQPLGIFVFPLILLVLFWTVCIKGVALWRSARSGHTAWFIVLLVANTLGILELIYLIWFKGEQAVSTTPTEQE